jgi:hypothetical protein
MGIALVLGLVCWTFGSSLQHVPREDQWSYLLDTVHDQDLITLVSKTYSYNRSRVIAPGDYQLFRPALFTLLAMQKAFFGARQSYCQLMGLLLHIGCVLAFLAILLRLGRLFPAESSSLSRLRVVFAYLLTAFFATNFAITEMVIWAHIQGYLLYTLCVLLGVYLLLDELCGRANAAAWRVALAFGVTLLAAFCYESGSFYALLLAGILGLGCLLRFSWRSGSTHLVWRAAFLVSLFGSVFVIYHSVDRLDRAAHPGAPVDITTNTIWEKAKPAPTLEHSCRYVAFTLMQPFFPTGMAWGYRARLIIYEPGMVAYRYLRPKGSVFLSFAVFSFFVGFGLWQLLIVQRKAQTSWHSMLPLLLCMSLFGLHLAIIALGRMNIRPGPKPLAWNSYYTYTPLALFLIAMYFLWIKVEFRERVSEIFQGAMIVALACILPMSMLKAKELCDHIALVHRPLYQQMNVIQGLIDQRQVHDELGVSFDPNLFAWTEEYHGLSVLEILYSNWINHEKPTHVICEVDGNYVALSAKEYAERQREPRAGPLPKYLSSSNWYNVFRVNDRYFGMYRRGNRFLDVNYRYPYLIEADSPESIRARETQVLQQLAADRQAGKPIPGE